MKQCENNSADRELGYYWEREFCKMAYNFGKCFSAHQWERTISALAYDKINKYVLPDITIWSCPGEHHEIKHKNPTKKNSIGLEKYRFNSLERFKDITKQHVYYTIHNHDLSGGRDAKENNILHWITAEIGENITVSNSFQTWGASYVAGQRKVVEMLYWNVDCFINLVDLWRSDKP